MAISLEYLGATNWLIRVHPVDGSYTSLTPYTWCCVVNIQGLKAELKGVCKPPTISEYRDIKKYFKDRQIQIYYIRVR